jgi:hypothetical protein
VNDVAAFARMVHALRPWLPQLVVVGGWAHRLHRLHALSRPPAHQPVVTLDADVAFAPGAPLAGDMGAALRAAGFREELSGEHRPPVSRYVLARGGAFEVEFLTAVRGSGRRRDGSADATLSRGGVTAQRLRHLDVLLAAPWRVSVGPASGVPLEPPAEVPLANPVSFLAQKLLIRHLRAPHKRAQDALYVHDTLELFADELPSLRRVWREEVRVHLPARTAAEVEALAGALHGRVDDVLRDASRIPQDRVLPPERMREVCAHGLSAIFAPAA